MIFLTFLSLLTSLSSAMPENSATLGQLRAIDAGGPSAYQQAAENCDPKPPSIPVPPSPCAGSDPCHESGRPASQSDYVDSESGTRVVTSPRNSNTVNITKGASEGSGPRKGGGMMGLLLGAGMGGVLGYGIALAIGCLSPFGLIALVAVGALAGGGAVMAASK